MTKTAFQQEREAAGKWVRAQMSSTQLSTYFVGVSEHDAIRAEAEAAPLTQGGKKSIGGFVSLSAIARLRVKSGNAPDPPPSLAA